jgi:hypothetical protein
VVQWRAIDVNLPKELFVGEQARLMQRKCTHEEFEVLRTAPLIVWHRHALELYTILREMILTGSDCVSAVAAMIDEEA